MNYIASIPYFDTLSEIEGEYQRHNDYVRTLSSREVSAMGRPSTYETLVRSGDGTPRYQKIRKSSNSGVMGVVYDIATQDKLYVLVAAVPRISYYHGRVPDGEDPRELIEKGGFTNLECIGGGVKAGQSDCQAMSMEMREEAGLEIAPDDWELVARDRRMSVAVEYGSASHFMASVTAARVVRQELEPSELGLRPYFVEINALLASIESPDLEHPALLEINSSFLVTKLALMERFRRYVR